MGAPEWHENVQLSVLFSRIQLISEDATQSSRIRFLMKNVLDERSNHASRSTSLLPAPAAMGPPPVLLGRVGSVRGDTQTSIDTKLNELENKMNEPFKHMEKLHPVLLARTGSVRGGDPPASVEIKHGESGKMQDELAKRMEHSNVHTHNPNINGKGCDTKRGQEVSISIALAVERTPLRSTASLFLPAIS